MANRLLPNVYSSLNDLSNLPEGQTSLTVGIVQRANKGPVNVPTLVTSPQNYLDTFMFGGIPSISDDPTTWSILKILAKTNTLYVSRAANNPMYGGVVFRTSTQVLEKGPKSLFDLYLPNYGKMRKFIIKEDGVYELVTDVAQTGTQYAQYTIANKVNIDPSKINFDIASVWNKSIKKEAKA